MDGLPVGWLPCSDLENEKLGGCARARTQVPFEIAQLVFLVMTS